MTTLSAGRMLLGLLFGALGHGLALGCAFLAGEAVDSSLERDFRSLGAAVAAFLAVEVLVLIGVIVAVIVLLIRTRRDLALGVFLGWLVGPAVFFGTRLFG